MLEFNSQVKGQRRDDFTPLFCPFLFFLKQLWKNGGMINEFTTKRFNNF